MRTRSNDRASPTGRRIVHLTTVHPWDDVRIYHKMCRGLALAGYDVTLVAPVSGHYAAEDGVRVVPIRVASGRVSRLLGVQRSAWKAVRDIKPDLVHFHDPELMPLGVVLRLLGTTVVYDAHEDLSKQIRAKPWIPARLRPMVSVLAGSVEQLGSRLLDHVVTATEPISRHFTPERTTVVRNFPSLREFTVPSEVAGNSSRSTGDGAVVYVGGLTRVRGIAELVEAMDHVESPDARLALAGRFSPKEFEDELRASTGWSRTDTVGWLDRDQIGALLASASVGVVTLHPTPNHMESMPIKLFEYMAAGLPVVISDFPYFRQLVGSLAMYVDPFDSHAIARAIDWLLTHQTEAAGMGANARVAVEREFNWESELTRLLDLYVALLGPPGSDGQVRSG